MLSDFLHISLILNKLRQKSTQRRLMHMMSNSEYSWHNLLRPQTTFPFRWHHQASFWRCHIMLFQKMFLHHGLFITVKISRNEHFSLFFDSGFYFSPFIYTFESHYEILIPLPTTLNLEKFKKGDLYQHSQQFKVIYCLGWCCILR